MAPTTLNPETQKEKIKAKFGFVPNLLAEIGRSPATLELYMQGQAALAQGSLTPKQMQAVQLTVSSMNGCFYCLAAHGTIMKQLAVAPEDVQAIIDGRLPADEDLAIVVLAARRVWERHGHLSPEEIRRFETQGVDRVKLYEIIGLIALKVVTNFIDHLNEITTDPQFGG